MQQEDIQKRMLIFFVAVSFLLITFSVVSPIFLKDTSTQQQRSESTLKQTEQKPVQQVSNLDLILTEKRTQLTLEKIRKESETGYIEFTPQGGRIVSIYDRHYNQDMVPEFSKKNYIFPGEIITNDPNLTQLLNLSRYEISQSEDGITFYLKGENFEVTKKYRVNRDGTIDLSVYSKGLENYSLWFLSAFTLRSEGSFGHEGPIVKTNRELIKHDLEDVKNEITLKEHTLWAGEENKYFQQITAVKSGVSTVKIIPVGKETTAILMNVPVNFEGFIFGGPKLYSLLGDITEKYNKLWSIDLDLRSSIDFGFFGIFGKPLFLLLHFFYQYLPNWGVAIIILTILIRIIFFPLNHKSLKAMKKMADLAPEMEKLKKKYSKDPQKLQEEMIKLYSQAGANPLSGCLPILVQIPVFIALYNVLMVTVELKGAPFILWIKDLSDKDPYYILPILMGLSMVAQQVITPSTDKNQQIIMYVMAAVFTFMFLTFPAGLVLYWLTNNILGLIQSFIVNKTMKR